MSPVPIFLDTDIGGDIDDTWALAFLLNCPELKLEYALTCVPVTSYRAKVVAKLFQWANNTETPIGMYCGSGCGAICGSWALSAQMDISSRQSVYQFYIFIART